MQSKIDIKPEHLEIVKHILTANISKDITVWVFGSRAIHRAKIYSDLDLALENKTGEPLAAKTLIKLQNDFENSNLPWKVDVVDYANLSDDFKKIINRDKQPLNFIHDEP